MKHCHFSILSNEKPFLKHKLPFLYKHFEQIIFYDLNQSGNFSEDGSHEYIKNFPDPEKKIILIEKRDLSEVKKYKGASFTFKRKMFAVGSSFVRDDMDVFWCTDMDEFFRQSLIVKVEKVLKDNRTNTIQMPHLIFFKNQNLVYSRQNGDIKIMLYCRIARHKKGNLYGHCSLQSQYPPHKVISDESIYHFAYVGRKRVESKCAGFFDKRIKSFKETIDDSQVHGYPNMHPSPYMKLGVKRYKGDFPSYIDVERLMSDLRRGEINE